MNRLWIVLLLFIAALRVHGPADPVCAEEPSSASTEEPLKIDKLYFLFHPVCWRMHGPQPPKGVDQENWTACYNRELRVNEEQKKFMSRMQPNEALIMFPISRSKPMLELEEHATEVLGRRAIIVRRGGKDPPRDWAELTNPIERFLTDPQLKGKAEFLKGVPAAIQTELAAEIREARQNSHSTWNVSVLEVAYYSRLCAMDIRNEFKKRNLHFDPQTTRSEAFGEGFEQCAMTWKQMLVPYLGLAHPAENRFDLSVSGGPFLVNATLKERVKLSHDLRLFLWEGKDDRLIGMYARAWCRLKDPQVYARVPLANMSLEVREVHDKQCWPKPDASELRLQVEDDHLKVPIFNGIRRDFDWRKAVRTDEEACYLIAENISLADFRERLLNARIGE
jgi:hypothetical protein